MILIMTSLIDAIVIGGGQSGLAAAGALLARGLAPIIVEASHRPVGSWPNYYDSLSLFSPARYSALPGLDFPGDPNRYPDRDEVAAYLAHYGARLGVPIHTGVRAEQVTITQRGFAVRMASGEIIEARTVIAATGGGRPHRPQLVGLSRFAGTVLHTADYRTPEGFAGQRVVVVGAGNSAVQVAVELSDHATVSLATRKPVRFLRQRLLGKDGHFWITMTGLDTAAIGPRLAAMNGNIARLPVLDTGRYRRALKAGRSDRRPMFTGLDGHKITWADKRVEHIDAIILATGYRPNFDYLASLGALDANGRPYQSRGLSTVRPGLGFVGLDLQRSLSSATLRGVGRDAAFVAARLISI